MTYRAGQFLNLLTAKRKREHRRFVYEILDPSMATLFFRMSDSDQAHSVRVFQTLVNQGEEDDDLLRAALLHDVGKSLHPLRAWERSLVVVTNQMLPNQILNWGKSEPYGWRKPFVVALQHPEWGAVLVQQEGGSETLVTLIRYHQELALPSIRKNVQELLERLQTADGMN
ncbi:MAG: HD domain-containing protein [Anaerolineales bacterium]|nr:HD domain-containing protein [Anaerolineales bacterium]